MSIAGAGKGWGVESVVDIKELFEIIPKTYFSTVRVCSVPKLFSSVKKKCFTPRLVGLGPYHHWNVKLTMADELKLGVVKRILLYHKSTGDFISDVEDFHFTLIECSYHPDSRSAYNYDSSKFASSLIVDGLFLLALLHRANGRAEESSNYILTGEENGMTLVNAAGEDLTMDGIISDIFMLENQIPTLVLEHIIEVNFQNHFPIPLKDLGSLMLNFCKEYSPLIHSANEGRVPEPNHHLLHLMYHYLIAPDPHDRPRPNGNGFLYYALLGLTYLFLLLWIIVWYLVYCVVSIVQPFLQLIPFVLGKFIPLLGTILHQPETKFPTPLNFLISVLDWSLYNAFTSKISFPVLVLIDRFTPVSIIIGVAVETTRRFLKPKDKRKYLLEARIPSVTQLHEAKIQFKPVEGDIYSMEFDEIKRELYLPRMKLNATSEVIFRNLAVYESLIKTESLNFSSHESLNFSSYIEFVSALIRTPADVKILAEENVIQTRLSAIGVAHMFKEEIGKSTGAPTVQIQKLEEQLKKVKPKFDAVKNVNLVFSAFMRICIIIGVLVLFSPLLFEAIHEVLCSTIFGNTSQSCKRGQVADYAGNGSYISSM